jgi:hypothetical protein
MRRSISASRSAIVAFVLARVTLNRSTGWSLTRRLRVAGHATGQDGSRTRTTGRLGRPEAAPDRPASTAWRVGRSAQLVSVSRPGRPRAEGCRHTAAARRSGPRPRIAGRPPGSARAGTTCRRVRRRSAARGRPASGRGWRGIAGSVHAVAGRVGRSQVGLRPALGEIERRQKLRLMARRLLVARHGGPGCMCRPSRVDASISRQVARLRGLTSLAR